MKRISTVYMICLLLVALVLSLGACRGKEDLMAGTEEWTHQICETHDEGEWFVEKEPTKTEEGKKILACTKCGEPLMSVPIPMLGAETETTAAATTASAAESEDAAVASCVHDGGEWVITKEPTATEAGEKQLKCTKCGGVLMSIPLLPTGGETETTTTNQ